CLFAAAGSVSGAVKDPSGAAIPSAQITLINTAIRTEFKATSDAEGLYSFPSLPAGQYDLAFNAPGFQTQQKSNLMVDTDAALRVDAMMQLGDRSDSVTVTESPESVRTQVETV